MSEFINYLTDEEIREVHADLDRCKRAIEGDDISAIHGAIKDLEKSSYKIAEVMYKDVS